MVLASIISAYLSNYILQTFNGYCILHHDVMLQNYVAIINTSYTTEVIKMKLSLLVHYMYTDLLTKSQCECVRVRGNGYEKVSGEDHHECIII